MHSSQQEPVKSSIMYVTQRERERGEGGGELERIEKRARGDSERRGDVCG